MDVRRAFGRQQAGQRRDGREQRGDGAERERIGRSDRKPHGLKEARQSERAKQSGANAQSNGHCAFLERHSKNVGALCTHGYANADFVGASAEGVGHDAVDADGSEEKSNAGEEAEESKAPLRKKSGNHSVHGAHAEDGNARIHVLNLRAYGLAQNPWFAQEKPRRCREGFEERENRYGER